MAPEEESASVYLSVSDATVRKISSMRGGFCNTMTAGSRVRDGTTSRATDGYQQMPATRARLGRMESAANDVSGSPPRPVGRSAAIPPRRPPRPNLPANVVPAERVTAGQFLAGVRQAKTRGGAWITPREVHALSLTGGVALGYREAGMGPEVTELTVVALRGGVDVMVFPGLQVECSGAGVLGGFVCEPHELADVPAGSGDPESPVLRVDGMAQMGDATFGTHLPREREKDVAGRRKPARKARRKELRRW